MEDVARKAEENIDLRLIYHIPYCDLESSNGLPVSARIIRSQHEAWFLTG